MSDYGFDPVLGALNTSLNLRLLNQNVISSNIANDGTPGYRAKSVEFESSLRDALGLDHSVTPRETHPRHRARHSTDPIYPEIYEDPHGVESLDGNTVNRAQELAKLAENQILYQSSAELVKKKLGQLKYAVTEGGGGH